MLLGSFENDLITFQSFFVGFVLMLIRRGLGPNHWVKLNLLTKNISSPSQISAGHGVQLALQFNGKVRIRNLPGSMLQQGFCQDQVADDFPRTGQQENQIATFVDPDMEEV